MATRLVRHFRDELVAGESQAWAFEAGCRRQNKNHSCATMSIKLLTLEHDQIGHHQALSTDWKR